MPNVLSVSQRLKYGKMTGYWDIQRDGTDTERRCHCHITRTGMQYTINSPPPTFYCTTPHLFSLSVTKKLLCSSHQSSFGSSNQLSHCKPTLLCSKTVPFIIYSDPSVSPKRLLSNSLLSKNLHTGVGCSPQ